MGKSSLFRKPYGLFFRLMGGIAVERSQKNNLVAAMIALFHTEPWLRLVVPVEGTRAYNQFWRSGFYYIAKSEDVPILTTFLDYSKKSGGFGAAIYLIKSVKADMDKLRAFYATVKGKLLSQSSAIKLKEKTQGE